MMQIDRTDFFEQLADRMNARPERFRVYGEAYMTVGIVMRQPGGDFRVCVEFDGLRARTVGTDPPPSCDYWLDGPIDAWAEMFAGIAGRGRAEGLQTINSLVLLGDRITLRGSDPMGLDKFSRFNQTLQEFLDGAAMAPVA